MDGAFVFNPDWMISRMRVSAVFDCVSKLKAALGIERVAIDPSVAHGHSRSACVIEWMLD